MKNLHDPIRNWTCDLPASSAVPWPTAPTATPNNGDDDDDDDDDDNTAIIYY